MDACLNMGQTHLLLKIDVFAGAHVDAATPSSRSLLLNLLLIKEQTSKATNAKYIQEEKEEVQKKKEKKKERH